MWSWCTGVSVGAAGVEAGAAGVGLGVMVWARDLGCVWGRVGYARVGVGNVAYMYVGLVVGVEGWCVQYI